MVDVSAPDRPGTPQDKTLHLICDNYATHKHPKVQQWLKKHSRFHIHFTPTSASWLNRVERLFRNLISERLRRGVFTGVPQLIGAIETFIKQHNESPNLSSGLPRPTISCKKSFAPIAA
jgi:transposase